VFIVESIYFVIDSVRKLLDTPSYFSQSNRIADKTLLRIRNYFSLHLVGFSPYRKIFQIKGVDLNPIYILFHVLIFCTVNHFLENR
jgi:hypothetical protein